MQLLHEKTTGAAIKIEVELVGDPQGVIPFVAKAVVDGQVSLSQISSFRFTSFQNIELCETK